jgi:hypothetical protein
VAVHQPGAWVILLERNSEVPATGKRSCIAARWIVETQASVRAAEVTGTLGEYPEIMAVKVYWMRRSI